MCVCARARVYVRTCVRTYVCNIDVYVYIHVKSVRAKLVITIRQAGRHSCFCYNRKQNCAIPGYCYIHMPTAGGIHVLHAQIHADRQFKSAYTSMTFRHVLLLALICIYLR